MLRINPLLRLRALKTCSSAGILSKFQIQSKTPPLFDLSSRNHSTLAEKLMKEQQEREDNLKREVNQLLHLFQIKQNSWIHPYAPALSGSPCVYYSDLKKIIIEMNKVNKFNQKSFDTLDYIKLKYAVNCLHLLEDLQLYNDENLEYLFSLDNYESLERILRSFTVKQLENVNYSSDDLNKDFEFVKKHSDAITGIAKLLRATMKWSDIISLLKNNERQLFDDKAYILHLLFNDNTQSNSDIEKNQKIIKETLILLNEEEESIPAVMKELKKNSDQYKFIKSDVVPLLIDFAKKSKLPSQLEQLKAKESSFKP